MESIYSIIFKNLKIRKIDEVMKGLMERVSL